jgi:hypothetical protein
MKGERWPALVLAFGLERERVEEEGAHMKNGFSTFCSYMCWTVVNLARANGEQCQM